MPSNDHPSRRLLRALPLLSHPGGRSAMTCRYRCGSACAHPAPNTSDNPYLGDIVSAAVSRRSILRAAAVVGLVGATGGALAACTPAPPAPAGPAPGGPAPVPPEAAPGLRFTPVAPNTADAVTVADGYQHEVVVRWGEPIVKGGPAFDAGAQSGAAQALQFGYNCDYLAMQDLNPNQLIMVSNHEYTDEVLMFAAYDKANPTKEQFEIALAAHGLSVVVFDKNGASVKVAAGHDLNRRITGATAFQITGPAAGSDFLKTAADPTGTTVFGTLNNCGGGVTPWGTVLSGEENFNQYFGNADGITEPAAAARLKRYGFAAGASERKWERFDARFDVAKDPNEVNRFGWVVELDPRDPTFVPRKRTALGRFKHEAAEPRLTPDGRVALYMGDDERFDYLYKFVSTDAYRQGDAPDVREHNLGLLDNGTLYVAAFTGNSPAAEIDGSGKVPADGNFDGSGKWIPLARGAESIVPGMTAAEVYVFTREAADKVGATKMDRPEDVEPHPKSGVVYVALTNNSDRGADGKAGVDEANPRKGNKHGQVLELTDDRNDSSAETFTWRLFLVCGDPADASTYFAGFPKDQVSPISCPDNLAFDEHGNLWIATDGNALKSNDGLFGVAVEGPQRGQVKQFLTVPSGAETCGPIVQKDRVFVAVQHPGEKDGATVEKPASTWPDGPGHLVRPSVIVAHRAGAAIGA
ncbi:PhoX family protein [Pseudonocardia sp. TRM90224]|uniref:PhoX family protein n=1 Tax=Pseudonocardia sp. TRM90224 TaxID=2812678 RepID=UPI001E5B7632|nr:PhoX family phosphatase [Pseudonocardia sp. TRM90224]